MPDRERGYVKRKQGVLPPDAAQANRYRCRQREAGVLFSRDMLAHLVKVGRGVGEFLGAVVHTVFTDPTHVHVVISWHQARTWLSMRNSVKAAFTRALNTRFGRRRWFVDSASRKRVRDRAHLDYLLTVYRRKHSGPQWVRENDLPP